MTILIIMVTIHMYINVLLSNHENYGDTTDNYGDNTNIVELQWLEHLWNHEIMLLGVNQRRF